MSYILDSIPQMLLMLPVVLFSLSVHEAAHGFVAYKLGDPTARNLGRLTLNPMKHINPIGFFAMLLFRVGWANPVPINTRYFKNPKRDMALSAAAGPISNLCLSVIFAVFLRIAMIPTSNIIASEIANGSLDEEALLSNGAFTALSLIVTMLYLGVSLNLNLMFFNLVPLPPLDGSRIAYIFLPTGLYFKVMKYERYIMIAFLLLFATGIIDLPLSVLSEGVSSFLYKILGMPSAELFYTLFSLFSRLPTFSL